MELPSQSGFRRIWGVRTRTRLRPAAQLPNSRWKYSRVRALICASSTSRGWS